MIVACPLSFLTDLLTIFSSDMNRIHPHKFISAYFARNSQVGGWCVALGIFDKKLAAID